MGECRKWISRNCDRATITLCLNMVAIIGIVMVNIVSCAVPVKDLNQLMTKDIATQAVEIWKDIDTNMDNAFVSMGNLYGDGKITDQVTNDLIGYGDHMHVCVTATKDTIQSYLWEKNINSDPASVEKKRHTMLVSLANLINSYFNIYAEMSAVHYKASGFPLPPVQLALSKEIDDYVAAGRAASTKPTNGDIVGEQIYDTN